MTLTIPTAGVDPGRAPRATEVVAPETGAGLARLGEGLRVLADMRNTAQRQRLQLDLERDMNDLRLEFEQIGDPDIIQDQWPERTAALRAAYLEPAEDGSRRVPPALQNDFGLMFDSLDNRHSFALGRRGVALRQAQQEATWLDFQHYASTAAAAAPPDERGDFLAAAEAQLDTLLANGIIDAAEAERRRQSFARQIDEARAIQMLSDDPGGFLESLDQGGFPGLSATDLARYRVRAEGDLATAGRAQASQIGDELGELTRIYGLGRSPANADILDLPEYQAHPAYAEAVAARDLAEENPEMGRWTVRQLRQRIAEERNRPITYRYQAERLEVLEGWLERAEAGWNGDQIAYAREAGFSLPEIDFAEFDPNDLDGLRRQIQQRVAFAEIAVEGGYTDQPRLFDDVETAQIRALSGVDQPPETRLAMAGLLQEAGALNLVDDDVFRHAGRFIADGNSPQVAAEILRGQQVLEEGNYILPPLRDRHQAVFTEFADIFADVPGGEGVQARIVEAADALYASRARRLDPDGEIDERIYRQALHEVLGGTGTVSRSGDGNAAGERGGVQTYNGQRVIFPSGVGARDFQSAMANLDQVDDQHFGHPNFFQAQQFGGYDGTREEWWAERDRRGSEVMQDRLVAASLHGNPPEISGQPVSLADLQSFELQVVGNDQYMFVVRLQGGVSAIADSEGNPFIFSMRDLVAEVGR